MSKFNDNTPMPWGKYKGKPMVEVPDTYLVWLWDDSGFDRTRNAALFAYIESNLEAIRHNIKNSTDGGK